MTKLSSFHLSGKLLDHNKYLYSDEQLISRFQAGDENAYVELVNRFKDKLTNFVYYFTKMKSLVKILFKTHLLNYMRKNIIINQLQNFQPGFTQLHVTLQTPN